MGSAFADAPLLEMKRAQPCFVKALPLLLLLFHCAGRVVFRQSDKCASAMIDGRFSGGGRVRYF